MHIFVIFPNILFNNPKNTHTIFVDDNRTHISRSTELLAKGRHFTIHIVANITQTLPVYTSRIYEAAHYNAPLESCAQCTRNTTYKCSHEKEILTHEHKHQQPINHHINTKALRRYKT